MAVIEFRGDYPLVRQVETITIGGTIAVNDIFTITINGKTELFVATAITIANVVAGLLAALEASVIPEFADFTVDTTSTTLVLTGVTERPFVLTVDKTSAAGTIATTTTVAANGPSHYSAENMEGGVLPGAGDTMFMRPGSNLLYRLNQSGSGTLAAVYMGARVGIVGLPEYNSNGFVEYLPTCFTSGITLLDVGAGEGSGPALCKIDFHNVQTLAVIRNSGGQGESSNGFYSVQLKNMGASSVGRLVGGSIDVCPRQDDVGTFATLAAGGNSVFRVGMGTTLTNFVGEGSTQGRISCATTTIRTQGSPNLVLEGAGAHPTIEAWGGSIDYRSSGAPFGTIGSIGQAVVTFVNSVASVTAAGVVTLGAGASLIDSMRRVTWSNPIELPNCGLTDVALDFGRDIKVTVAPQ
jgi:hypothetical protein